MASTRKIFLYERRIKESHRSAANTIQIFNSMHQYRELETTKENADDHFSNVLNESKDLFKQGVELRIIGDITGLPEHCEVAKEAKLIRQMIPTWLNSALTIVLWEITDAIKSIVNDRKTVKKSLLSSSTYLQFGYAESRINDKNLW